jgi:hypothetical protein
VSSEAARLDQTGSAAPSPEAPRYGEASLADLLPSVLAGMEVPGAPPVLGVPAAPRVVVLLIDGLGQDQLDVSLAHAPFLASLRGQSLSIDAGFPATTPVSLTSLGTGLPPGQHGITGFFLRRPRDGAVISTLNPPPDLDPLTFQPRETVFQRAARAGVAVTRVGPRAFDGTGLTEIGLRGGAYRGADSIGERIAATVAAATTAPRALVYSYFGDLDATAHRCGWRSDAWRQELRHVDNLVEQLAAELPPDVLLLVTADHGMVDIPAGGRWDLATTPELDAGVDVLAGDPRAVHVHTRPGAADDVLASWSAVLGDAAWVRSRDEAVAAGWFGPVSPGVLDRLGDVVVAVRDDIAVVDSRVLPPNILGLVGMHGSLTTAEQRVPLLVRPV